MAFPFLIRNNYFNFEICLLDLNECEQFHPCDENSVCVNTLGSYKCECVKGFEKTTLNQCHGNLYFILLIAYCKNVSFFFFQDIDECNSNSNNCHQYAKCINTYGSYNCSCSSGFYGNGTYCEDLNECALNPSICNSTGTCVNTIGYYRCECQHGYELAENSNECVGNNLFSC